MSDRIEFIGRPHREGDRSSGIRVRINGHDLADLVQVVELPFAEAEGAPEIAGAYAGLPPGKGICPPSRHFYGEPAWEVYDYGGRTQVLQCDCGEPGCWPLVCRIELTDDQVVWSGFEQPHRASERGRSRWTYETFGPFHFERRQYETALEALRRAGEHGLAPDEPAPSESPWARG
jgi:hypothetical protein